MGLCSIRALLRTTLVVFATITSFAASSDVLYNAPLVPLYELRVTCPQLPVDEYRIRPTPPIRLCRSVGKAAPNLCLPDLRAERAD